MHLMLNEEVHQRHNHAKERPCQPLPPPDRPSIANWTQRQTSQSPRQGRDQIGDHEDIVPVMIVRRSNVRPPTARQGPEHSNARHPFRPRTTGRSGHAVEERDKQESRPRTCRDEELEDGAFGVAIAYGCGDGRKPFDRIAEVLILNDFVVMERETKEQGAQEGTIGRTSMEVSD